MLSPRILMGLLPALALLLAAVWFGPAFARLLLPSFQAACTALAPELGIRSLRLLEQDGQWVFRLDAITSAYVFLDGRALPAGLELSATTLLGHALQHPVILGSTVALWPDLPARKRAAALLMAVCLVLPTELLDVPLVLLGSVWDLLEANFAPGHRPLLAWWMDVMNGGGRLLLSLLAGASAVLLGDRLA